MSALETRPGGGHRTRERLARDITNDQDGLDHASGGSGPCRFQETTVYADGGTIGGSPGRAVYWSYGLPETEPVRRFDRSGRYRRAEEAELLALIGALRFLGRTVGPGGNAVLIMDCLPVVRALRAGAVPRKRRAGRSSRLLVAAHSMKRRLEERGVCVEVRWAHKEAVERVLGH